MIDREYKEIMDRVKVTESMKAEVLRNAASAPVFEHQKGRHIASSGRSGRWSRRLVAAVCAGAACAACLLAFPAFTSKYDIVSPNHYELKSGVIADASASSPGTSAPAGEISGSVQASDVDKGTTVHGRIEENDGTAQDSDAFSGEANSSKRVHSLAGNTPQAAASPHESAVLFEEAPSDIAGGNSQVSAGAGGSVSGFSPEAVPNPDPDLGQGPSNSGGGGSEASIAAAGPWSPPPEMMPVPEAVPEPSEAPAGCESSCSPEPSESPDNAEEFIPAASDTPEPIVFPVASESSSPMPTSCIEP